MSTPEQIQKHYYEQTASIYNHAHVHEGDEHFHALQWMLLLLRGLELSSILDVGSGTGRGVEFFASRGFHALGVEPVHALARQCKSTTVEASGEALPFDDCSFDAVCETGMLHHVAQPERVIREMFRVARRIVFISDSNRFGQGRRVLRFVKLALCRSGLWRWVERIRTHGRGYHLSEGDGLCYSYSVFDHDHFLAQFASDIIVASTENPNAWASPLTRAGHVLVAAIKK